MLQHYFTQSADHNANRCNGLSGQSVESQRSNQFARFVGSVFVPVKCAASAADTHRGDLRGFANHAVVFG